ncbi:MAG: hypothetical protein RL571_3372 [Pseudomonadota bacterium]
MVSAFSGGFILFFISKVMLFVLMFWGSSRVHAGIYAFVDENGQLSISAEAADSRFKHFNPHKLYRSSIVEPKRTVKVIKLSEQKRQLFPIIDAIAQEEGVDPRLLHAVIKVESQYDPEARSAKGALGLMQLIPATASRFGASDALDPRANVRAGARYLKWLNNVFLADLSLVLAAYNAGEGAVRKYGNAIPPYPETQAYVRKVLSFL